MSHFVATENVFETIGNYPVVDQFDIDYTGLLSGSTYDHYITGSLFQYVPIAAGIGNFNRFVLGERGRAFSKLGVSQDNRPGGSFSKGTSYQLQPWRERANSVRYTKCFSNFERYYDSLTPNPLEMLISLDSQVQGIFVATGSVSLFMGSLAEYGRGFGRSFPFEPKYNGLNRNKKNIYTCTINEEDATIPPKVVTKTYVTYYVGSGGPLEGYLTLQWVNKIGFGGDYYLDREPLTDNDSNKIIFGFGDLGKQVLPIPQRGIYDNFVMFRAMSGSMVAGPVTRGWRYGLIDGNPLYTSCIFRRDKYGQLRDMLEQRYFTRFINDVENSTFRYYDDDATSEKLAIPLASVDDEKPAINASAVSVNFQQRLFEGNKIRWVSKAATLTSSSNISQFCTSSLPYFDDNPRNR